MIVLVGLLLVALVVTQFLWLYEVAAWRRDWEQERIRLLNRVLHPEVVQMPEIPAAGDPAPPEPDEYGLVGTVLPYSEDEE